jgi:hypothetical protein
MKFHLYSLCALCISWLSFQTAQAQKQPFPQYNGEKFALIEAQTLKVLTPYKYESIATFKDGLALATFRSEVGKLQYTFLNPQGKEIIIPSPNRTFEFSEGKARFKQADKFGFLDTQGKAIVPANYAIARDYKEGRTIVRDADSVAMILDEQGKLVARLSAEYNFVKDYSDGFALVGNAKEGTEVDDPNIYTLAKGDFVFFNKQGKIAIDLKRVDEKINHASSFQHGVAIVAILSDDYSTPAMYGAINTKGELILPLQYTYASMDKAGYINLQMTNKDTYQTMYGLADNTGKILIPVEYAFLFEAVGKYRAFQKRMSNMQDDERFPDRYGIMDLAGKIVEPAIHRDIYLQKDGYFITLDSVKVDAENIYQILEQYYSYRHVSGTVLQEKTKMVMYNSYADVSEIDKTDGELDYRPNFIPVRFNNKVALLNQEQHALLTPFFDEIAPFAVHLKGEKLAVREGKSWFYLDENLERNAPYYEGATNFNEGNYAPVKRNGKWGLINRAGFETTSYSFDSIVPTVARVGYQIKNYSFNEMTGMSGSYDYETIRSSYLPSGNFIAQKNKKWGIINWEGKEILPLQYDAIHDAFYNYIVIGKGNKMSVIDYAGKELIPAQYDKIRVINDLAYVFTNGKEGLVDLQNNVIAPTVYDTIFEPQQNMIKVIKNRKIGYFSYEGKELLPAQYDAVVFYGTNQVYIQVAQNKKWGVLDMNFKPILACEYDTLVAEQWQKYFWVQKNGLQGLLDTTGKVVVPIKYQHIDNLERDNYTDNPRVLTAKLNNKWGVLDSVGKVIIPLEYDYMKMEYDRKQMVIGKKGKFGAMRTSGKLIIPIKYDELGNFYYDLNIIGIKKKGKWGYVDTSGKEVIKPMFDDANAFARVSNESNNQLLFASVKKGKYWGIINSAGKVVVPFQFDFIGYIPYSTTQPIQVIRNGKDEQIDFKGEPYKGE